MSAVLVASLAVALTGLLSLMSFLRSPVRKHEDQPAAGAAYILENTVTHARLLPTPATHAFSYPTLALLLSLDALEAGVLDLGRGWLFGYGGTAWRITGLRSGAYLLPDAPSAPKSLSAGNSKGNGSNGVSVNEGRKRENGTSLKAKLAEVLVRQGKDGARVWAWAETGDAWMLTMPSYVGYEGINPLTVYFCYARSEEEQDGALEWVVLEIHNTFGEKHVHVLEPGVREEQSTPGYDYTWTFLRDFHVSPFNDRAGFYTVSIALPPPPRSPRLLSSPPRPKIRILLRTASPVPVPGPVPVPAPVPDKLKLTATLFARRAVPFTSAHLLRALARYPFALLLSFARILYHAGILHYKKGLDVFPRPDPKPAAQGWRSPASEETEAGERVYGGIGWQPEGALEAYARGLTEKLLARRVEELGVQVELVSGDPSVPRRTFQPSVRAQEKDVQGKPLMIHYAAPRFFSTLLLAPSPEHMLLVGRAEDLFRVNSDSLFSQVFAASASTIRDKTTPSLTQRIRTALLPTGCLMSLPTGTPARHILDADRPLVNALAICALHLMDHLEKTVFTLLRARFVPGMEPWLRWDRAADLALTEHTPPPSSS